MADEQSNPGVIRRAAGATAHGVGVAAKAPFKLAARPFRAKDENVERAMENLQAQFVSTQNSVMAVINEAGIGLRQQLQMEFTEARALRIAVLNDSKIYARVADLDKLLKTEVNILVRYENELRTRIPDFRAMASVHGDLKDALGRRDPLDGRGPVADDVKRLDEAYQTFLTSLQLAQKEIDNLKRSLPERAKVLQTEVKAHSAAEAAIHKEIDELGRLGRIFNSRVQFRKMAPPAAAGANSAKGSPLFLPQTPIDPVKDIHELQAASHEIKSVRAVLLKQQEKTNELRKMRDRSRSIAQGIEREMNSLTERLNNPKRQRAQLMDLERNLNDRLSKAPFKAP